MVKQKDLKRLVRARMKKTGESYTTARTQLSRKKEPVAESDYAAITEVADATVHAKTGRNWKQWARVLDAVGAVEMSHRDIARHVKTDHDVDDWWAQTVTVGYERIRGLREKGQERSGEYNVSKSRTFPVPVDELYRAVADGKVRRRWLPDVDFDVSTATPGKVIRVAWPDRTRVEVYFSDKGAKSTLTVSHRKLKRKRDAEAARAYWSERLTDLFEVLRR